MLPSIILLEDDTVSYSSMLGQVLLPSIILLEDDFFGTANRKKSVLLPSIILLEDDNLGGGLYVTISFATIYYFARR